MEDQTHYDDNLRHMAEPADPRERFEADSFTLEDYEALWFAEALYDFGSYYADGVEGTNESVAKGYAEYLDRKVREAEDAVVDAYAHTELAVETLMAAALHAEDGDLKQSVLDAISPLYVEYSDEVSLS